MAANLKDLPRRHYTLEEYFALEKVGDARYEYWDGDIVWMSGGTIQHAVISDNIYSSLRSKLKGKECRAFSSSMPIKTPLLPPYRYPDASVVCSRLEIEKINGIDVIINPTLIIEILSPATEILDRNQKKNAFQAIETVQEYLLVAQDEPHITQFIRTGESWIRQDFSDLSGAIKMLSGSCQIALSEIYENVTFN